MADPADLSDDLSRLVRGWDRPRYYAALFSPAPIRADLLALYGFAAEVARIPDLVSEATLGEIRLQFWRDALDRLGSAGPDGATPPLRALAEVVRRRALPVAPLVALVEARRADLYSDPPAKLSDVEGFLGETQSSLFQLAAIIHGSAGPETAEASGHAGVAYGLARRVAGFAAERARGRTILPLDLLAMEGLAAADVFAPEPNEGLHKAVTATVGLARHHLRNARERLPAVPAAIRPAYLPLAVVEPLLDRAEALGPALASQTTGLPDLESLARIAWARIRAR
jgi:phytoene synthase